MNQLDILSSARTIRKLDKTTISSLTPAQLVNGLIVLKAFPEVDLKKELATRLDDSFKMDVGNWHFTFSKGKTTQTPINTTVIDWEAYKKLNPNYPTKQIYKVLDQNGLEVCSYTFPLTIVVEEELDKEAAELTDEFLSNLNSLKKIQTTIRETNSNDRFLITEIDEVNK